MSDTIKIYPTNNIFLNNTFIEDCKNRFIYNGSNVTENSTSKLVNDRNITIKTTETSNASSGTEDTAADSADTGETNNSDASDTEIANNN